MDQDFIPALYGNLAKDMGGTPFRLRDTKSEVNYKRSYVGFQLALPSFYGRLVDPSKPAWESGNYQEKDGTDEWQEVSFDLRKIYAFKIPDTLPPEDGVAPEVTANDGTTLPAGVIYGRMKNAGGDLRAWTPGNFEVCIVEKWKTVGKGRQAVDPQWIDCDFDRIKYFQSVDDGGKDATKQKPLVDKPEKFTTFHIAFKDPVILHRKDKEGRPVEKEAIAVELEAPHYLALALHAKIADKSEDGGNPLNYWMTWSFDREQTDNALRWKVSATKMTPEDIAALTAPAESAHDSDAKFTDSFGEDAKIDSIPF